MTSLIVGVFALTYLGMALGRVPGLKIDRTGIALLALAVLLAVGAIDLGIVGQAVDFPTILLLFALMLLSAQFALAGFYEFCAERITNAAASPRSLLIATVLVSGALSAVLANDIVVFAMTPLLCQGLARRGLDPRPYLMALAGASNAGSAATLIGNPQNILIGQVGGLDFWRFLQICGPPALISLGIVAGSVLLMWRREIALSAGPPAEAPPAELDRWQVVKGLLATAALLALFLTPAPREIGALGIAALLLASRRMASRTMIGMVDWHLLLLFACLFTITAAFAATGLAGEALEALRAEGFWPDRLAVQVPLALLASNTIGNVPAVILLLSIWNDPSPQALYGLALMTTLAGNFLLVGSLANIIVAERASASGFALRFADFARAGVPMTLLSMALAAVWLMWMEVIAW